MYFFHVHPSHLSFAVFKESHIWLACLSFSCTFWRSLLIMEILFVHGWPPIPHSCTLYFHPTPSFHHQCDCGSSCSLYLAVCCLLLASQCSLQHSYQNQVRERSIIYVHKRVLVFIHMLVNILLHTRAKQVLIQCFSRMRFCHSSKPCMPLCTSYMTPQSPRYSLFKKCSIMGNHL